MSQTVVCFAKSVTQHGKYQPSLTSWLYALPLDICADSDGGLRLHAKRTLPDPRKADLLTLLTIQDIPNTFLSDKVLHICRSRAARRRLWEETIDLLSNVTTKSPQSRADWMLKLALPKTLDQSALLQRCQKDVQMKTLVLVVRSLSLRPGTGGPAFHGLKPAC